MGTSRPMGLLLLGVYLGVLAVAQAVLFAVSDGRLQSGAFVVSTAQGNVTFRITQMVSIDFTVDVLAGLMARHRAPIKAVLCDQGIIAGVGNMYADEALFESRIHPLTPAADLSRAKVKRLYSAIQGILATAITNKGASVDTYFRPDGNRGAAHYQFKVAHRLNENCPACGGPIERIRVRGRGTYFCSKCQRTGQK